MPHPTPRAEMTRDQRIRWVMDEEQKLLRLLPNSNGLAVLASEGLRVLDQMNVEFIERVMTWIAYAEEVGIDPLAVMTRFDYNGSLYVADLVGKLNQMADVLEKAPATKMEYQDLILVATNRVRWAVDIAKPGGSTEQPRITRPPKPPTQPPDLVGARPKR